MKRKLRILYLLPLTAFALLISAFSDNKYYELNKNFEIFGTLIKELSNSYVTDISTDKLLKYGIDGMLESLDPYTEYYEPDDKESLDLITTGKYTGFGITVSTIENKITITDIQEGFGAYKSGLKIGDILYSIDSTVCEKFNSKELKPLTQGLAGSIAKIKVIRTGFKDTLSFSVQRQQVLVSNIFYSGILNDSIAYVKLERFTKDSDEDLKKCLLELSKEKKLKACIIDLRDNPGGLLESAVNITELFVPKGSLIVSTKGRHSRNNYSYSSDVEPMFPDLPLAIMINQNSASASEIVAGAIQDLDRGLVVGQKSFGKGLVQSVIDLPYNTSLKYTSAKYYTPSGRCIQKIEYNKAKIKDTNKINAEFYTLNKRKVKESNGIVPDFTISNSDTSSLINGLYAKNMFFLFTNVFVAKNLTIPNDFKISDQLYSEFKLFLEQKKFSYESPEMLKLKEVEKILKQKENSDESLTNLTILENSLIQDQAKLFENNKSKIKQELELEIKRRYVSEKEYNKILTLQDKEIQETIKYFNDKDYNRILAKDSESKNQKH